MLDIEQGSDAWLALRCGRVTASRMADLMARTKTGWGAGRANYMAEIIAERLTGSPADRFTNAAMQWGTEKEPDARAAYEFMVGADVEPVGFVEHPSIEMAGASPDGLVGSDGLVEIKCPNTATHIETLLGVTVPAKYVHQMQWQMECTGRAWCDFVSYDPRMPPAMQLFVKRVDRDEAQLAAMREAVKVFLAEAEQTVTNLLARYDPPEAKPARLPITVAG